MNESKKNKLVSKAVQWKKAWIMCVAFMGKPSDLDPVHLIIPEYHDYSLAQLRQELTDLKIDVRKNASQAIVEKWTKRTAENLIPWLESKFDAWEPKDEPIWELGRVHDIEAEIGRLAFRRKFECPLYAQVLAQGLEGVAIRHPEYHLAQDLALLNNLFFDCERVSRKAFLDEELKPDRMRISTEGNQSFARSVIITCFNLIESFVSGLATEYLLANPDADQELRNKLEDGRPSLRKRFGRVPKLVTGNEDAMKGTEKLCESLFSVCKKRRDSFVHCSPGPNPSAFGDYVKEEFFHDPGPVEVRETVSLTVEAISTVWEIVYSREGPKWLPNLDDEGLFPQSNFTLSFRLPNERSRNQSRID